MDQAVKDWLGLSPNHRKITSLEPGSLLRVTLTGPDKSDGPWSGVGKTEADATRHALEARELVRAQLP